MLHTIDYWCKKASRARVSVLCCTYNQEEYIEDALLGFLMQRTSFPFEVLINDDASTDETLSIVQHYARLFPERVRVVEHATNQFSKGHNNIGEFLEPIASGDYLALCEGDDYWIDDQKLQKQFELLEANDEIGFCGHASIKVDGMTNQVIGASKRYSSNQVVPYETMLSCVSTFATASFFVRRELFKRYVQSDLYTLKAHGDHKMSLFFGLQLKVYYIAEYMSVYRVLTKGSINRAILTGENRIAASERLYLDRCELVAKIDELTNGRYAEIIKNACEYYEFEHLMFAENGKEILSRHQKRLCHEPMRTIVKVLGYAIAPNLFSALLNMKRRYVAHELL